MVSQLIRVIERQAEIINILSESVDELCKILTQYLPPEEFANLDIMKKLNKAAALKRAIDDPNAFAQHKRN